MHNPTQPYLQISVAFNGKPLNTYTFAEREIVIGRSPECHVPLDNPGASRQHAKVVRDGNTLYVHDLQSGNGTFVNGKQVTKAVITPTDSLGISKFTLTAKLTDTPPKAHLDHRSEGIGTAGQDDGHTVFLRPAERAKIVEQAQPTAPATPTPSNVIRVVPDTGNSVAMVFAAGLAAGLLLGWLIWA